MNPQSLALAAWISTLLILPVQAGYISISAPRVSAQQLTSQLSQQQLKQLAQSITVKIFSGDSGGSGILIRKEGQVYTILTNQHVLEAGKPSRIQTPDGKTHQANLVGGVNFGENDLALLQFRANGNYAVASLGNSSTLKEGDEVFAAGFPFEANLSDSKGFVFRTGGQISLLLREQALEGGYRIGYTSEIEKGMSGGPVINREGKVIGVNGIHDQPLWGNPYVYQDGSQPNDAFRERMKRASWGVPISTFAQLAPQFVPADLSPQASSSTKPSTSSMPQVANRVENIAKEITVLITWPTSNGSGAIIAKEGNTYYVLTAKHVVSGNRELKIVTPDGQQYSVNNSTIKTWDGLDLALLQFTSDQTYQVATLGNYNLGNEDRVVFVSGWPESKQAKEQLNRQFTSGFLFGFGINQAKDVRSFSLGYELVYTNITDKGMSGGPVLDTQGRLIGIHTATEGEYTNPTPQEAGQEGEILLGYSLGIPIRTFVKRVEEDKMTLHWNQENSLPPSLSAPEQNEIVNSSLNLEAPENSRNEIDWLNYGNRLWRSLYYEKAVEAFDKAIEIKPDFYQALYARGLVLKLQKKYKEALESFNKATAFKPIAAEVWRQIGDTHYYLKQYKEAQQALEKAITSKPNEDFIAYQWLSIVLMEFGNYPEALKASNKAIKINPQPLHHIIQGYIRSSMGDYQAAAKDYSQALALQSDNTLAYQLRGQALSNQGDNQGAIADLNKAVHLQPDNAVLYAVRGFVYARMGNRQEFTKNFNQALRLQPDEDDTYIARGLAHADLGDYEEALNDFTQAIRLAPELAYQYYDSRGDVRAGQEDYKRAIEDYTEAILLESNYALAYISRGNAHAKNKDQQKFTEDFDKALRLQPNNAWIYSNRGDGRFLLKDYQGGIEDYNKAIRLAPELAYLFYAARGYERHYQQKDYHGAIADYTEAIRLNPGYASAYNGRCNAHYTKEDYRQAIADCTESIRLNSNNAVFYAARGDVRKEQKDYTGAIADYTAAIRLDSKHINAYNNRGFIRYLQQDYPGAIADYTAAIRLDSDFAIAYANRGDARKEQKDYPGAITDYTAAIRLDSDFAYAYYQRGNAHSAKEDYQGAITDYTEAIRLDPKYALAYINRGFTRYLQQDYPGAITDYTEAIRLDSDFAIVYANRGDAHKQQKDYPKAIADYTAAIRLDSDFAYAYYQRGNAHSAKEDYQGAITDYTEAIRLDPKYALAYNNRGFTRYLQKDYQGAIKDLAEAIRLDPKYAVTYANRGDAYQEQGDYPKAISDYTAAIRLDPKSAYAYKMRGQTRGKLKDYQGAIEDYNQVLRSSEFSGIGVQSEVNPKNKVLTVAKVIENSPAQKRGVKVGDQILAIDGQPTANMSFEGAIKLIRGKTGTQVTLQIAREGRSAFNLTLTRTPIANIDPQFAEVYYNRGFAHAQVADNQKAREDFQKAADLYQQQGNKEMYQQAQKQLRELHL